MEKTNKIVLEKTSKFVVCLFVFCNPLGFIVQKTGKLGLVKKDQKKYENLDLKETEGKNE